jgi:CRP-like cAMP-binding protein
MPALMLLRKLEQVMVLTDTEQQIIAALPERVLHVEPGEGIVDGSRADEVHQIRAGIACRYSLLQNGRRQITSFLVPGDWCNLRALLMGRIDHAVTAIAPCDVAVVPYECLFAVIEKHPRLALALWRDTLFDAEIDRECVVNVGRRTPYARIAHLFCEVWFRLEAVGLSHDYAFELPVTQTDLADAMGMSLVQVNRTIRQLRTDGLIGMSKGRVVRLLDWQRLTEVAEFDPAYLRKSPISAADHTDQDVRVKLRMKAPPTAGVFELR